MAIRILSVTGDFSNVTATLFGDGSSTSVSVDLEKAPCFTASGLPFDFKEKYPAAVATPFIVALASDLSEDTTVTAEVSINKSILTITLNKPLLSAPFPVQTGGLTAPGMAAVGIQFLYS
jgi:hypothetical protein